MQFPKTKLLILMFNINDFILNINLKIKKFQKFFKIFDKHDKRNITDL